MKTKLLLVDDELHILKAAEFKFKRQGYLVEIARDGQEAWEKVQASPPDMVVSDLQMPRLNGIQLIERLRADERFRDLPTILLTAKGFELDHSDITSRLSVLEIVSKPFSPRDLCERVERALANRVADDSPAEVPTCEEVPTCKEVPTCEEVPTSAEVPTSGELHPGELHTASTTS